MRRLVPFPAFGPARARSCAGWCPPRRSALGLPTGARVGPTDGPHVLHQGRRATRTATRGRRAAPQEPEATYRLGRPGRVRRSRAAVASRTASAVPGHPEHDPALAPSPRPPTMDLPPPDRTTTHRRRPRRPGSAHGAGEPALGIYPNPGRVAHTRPPHRRLDDPPDPPAPPHP